MTVDDPNFKRRIPTPTTRSVLLLESHVCQVTSRCQQPGAVGVLTPVIASWITPITVRAVRMSRVGNEAGVLVCRILWYHNRSRNACEATGLELLVLILTDRDGISS